MKTPKLYLGRLSLFGLLSCLDLVLTYQLLRGGGGYIYESNPIANEWLTRFGFPGLALFKILAMSTAAIAVILISLYRPQTGSRLINFACLVMSVVVVYSFSLSNVIGGSLDMEELPLALYQYQYSDRGPATEAADDSFPNHARRESYFPTRRRIVSPADGPRIQESNKVGQCECGEVP